MITAEKSKAQLKTQSQRKSKAELRRETKRAVDMLSDERLQAAAEFLAYLQYKESEDATEEILRIPGALEAYERGKKQIAEGKTVRMEDLKRKY